MNQTLKAMANRFESDVSAKDTRSLIKALQTQFYRYRAPQLGIVATGDTALAVIVVGGHEQLAGLIAEAMRICDIPKRGAA